MSKTTATNILIVLAISSLVRLVWALVTDNEVVEAIGGALVGFILFGFVYLLFRREVS